MAEDTWYAIAVPALEYLHAQPPMSVVNVGTMAAFLGVDAMGLAGEIDRLHEAGYLQHELVKPMTGGDPRPWHMFSGVTGAGAQVIGAWPCADAYDAMIKRLDELVAGEPDPARRSRMKCLRDAATDAGKTIVTEVIVDVLRRHGA
jgi:hypothetical protein